LFDQVKAAGLLLSHRSAFREYSAKVVVGAVRKMDGGDESASGGLGHPTSVSRADIGKLSTFHVRVTPCANIAVK